MDKVESLVKSKQIDIEISRAVVRGYQARAFNMLAGWWNSESEITFQFPMRYLAASS